MALTAKLALAREERLRRGDPRADESLAELQRDMSELIGQALRILAYAIHPPVLADQGLLEAIDSQAARLPLEVVIEADPALRGVRFPPAGRDRHLVRPLGEALTNAVKHAQCAPGARRAGASRMGSWRSRSATMAAGSTRGTVRGSRPGQPRRPDRHRERNPAHRQHAGAKAPRCAPRSCSRSRLGGPRVGELAPHRHRRRQLPGPGGNPAAAGRLWPGDGAGRGGFGPGTARRCAARPARRRTDRHPDAARRVRLPPGPRSRAMEGIEAAHAIKAEQPGHRRRDPVPVRR